MSASLQQFRLNRLPFSARVVLTWFVVLIGCGYLASVGHLYFTYAAADGQPGVSAQDLKLKLYGQREQTLLESKIDGGSMEQYLRSPAEKKAILSWIHAGADEEAFAAVAPIFERNCQGCHSAAGAAKFRPLTGYGDVAAVAKVDRGESPASWARVAHIHLQSLSVIYLLLGLVFAFCGVPERAKATVVSLPFIALLADFGARGFVPANENLVYVVMAGGMLGGISTVLLVCTALWELWISGRAPRQRASSGSPALGQDLAPSASS